MGRPGRPKTSQTLIPPAGAEHLQENDMLDPERLMFIHGLNGDGRGVKATLLRELFPEISTPYFPGSLEERMDRLKALLAGDDEWTLVGSSFGGLMAATFACEQPSRVRKQVLLAPALLRPAFAQQLPDPVEVPTVIFHGTQDDLIPLKSVRQLAERIFNDLTFHVVEDDHGLYETVHNLDWRELLA